MELRGLLASGVAGVILAAGAGGAAASVSAQASSAASGLEPRALGRAQTIRGQVHSRYRLLRGHKLSVTEATSTGVLESFTLLTPDLLATRVLGADNGIYYAICPARATCPYPTRRFARPAADAVPRRLALELAVRTFLETSADVVAVSLPSPRFVLFVAERKELARDVDLPTLARALGGDPSRALSASLEAVVDRVTRPRLYLFIALQATRSGRESWAGMPLWTGWSTP